MKETKLATKADISDFAKKADFDDKLNNFNKKITLSRTKHGFVENESNKLSEKVKLKSRKRLTKDLVNKCSIFNISKYFSSGVLQN